MNILVTSIGDAFAADIVIKTLRANHHHVTGCDVLPKEWIVDAYNVDQFVQAPKVTEKEEYIDFIKKVCRQNAIQYIMPLSDYEIDIICEIKSELIEQDVHACISDYEVIRLCRDKYLLGRYLEQHNICPTIPTCLLSEADETTLRYPMIAKLRSGRASKGLMMIKSRAEYGYVKEMTRNLEYIIQPFIEGNTLNVDVVRDSDHNVAVIARRDLLRHPSGVGTTVEIIENERLNEICIKTANLLGIIGAANLEFIETPDKLYLMEINPRPSGGVEFSHIAGYDVVSNHLRCFTGKAIDREINLKTMIIARKYEEYITKVIKA